MVNANTTNRPPQEASKHIVVVQLTRAGDLVQTLQAVKDVRTEKPDVFITLVARKHYAKSLAFLLETVFDRIVTFDTPKFFSGDLANSHKLIGQLVNDISQRPVDAIINLSYCKPSQYLVGLVPAAHRLGPWIGPDNQEVITDRWSQLLYTTVTQGSLNPFHLVDLFKLILGVKLKTNAKVEAATSRKDWIVVHPFASIERKKWKPHKWAEILYKLAKDNSNATVFVVGGPDELALAQELFSGELIKTRKNIVNLVAQTSVRDVFDRLKSAKLFIGHDSLIGHLASVAKTRTITLALGSVRPWETTPHGANNIVISPRTKCFPCFPQESCAQYICHSDIPYQLVTDIAALALKHDNVMAQFKTMANPFLTGTCLIHQTAINSKSGLMDFHELDPKPSAMGDIMRTFYRMTWAYTLGEMEENRGFPMLSRDAHATLLNTMEGLGYLYELSEFGKKYSMTIIEEIAKQSPSLSRIKTTSHKIDEIDRLALLVKKSHPSLAPIVDFFSVMRANLPGNNIVEIAQQSFFVYQDTALSISIISELIEKSIAEHKILLQRSSASAGAR